MSKGYLGNFLLHIVFSAAVRVASRPRVILALLLLSATSFTASTALALNKADTIRLLAKIDQGPVSQQADVIRYLGGAKYKEVVETLIQRYEAELYRAMSGDQDEPSDLLLRTILDSLIELTTEEFVPDIHELEEMTQYYYAATDRLPVYVSTLERRFSKLIEQAQSKSARLESLTAEPVDEKNLPILLQSNVLHPQMLKQNPKQFLEEFKTKLEKRIIGQPEVIQKLMDIEYRDAVYGTREKPEILLLMGAPGTGKDTSAEAYTDALHGYDNAYEEHLYRLPILKNKADLWSVLGSSTGYIGSDAFPPFLEFLVEHSGGRYKIEVTKSARGEDRKVIENPDWKPGEVTEGTLPPKSGVVFVNEFHNWSKEMKDMFLKQAIEKGIFTINNPNGGIDKMTVPVTFIIASNDGIGLVTSREANGERFGRPLTYEQQLARWEAVYNDSDTLRRELAKANGAANSPNRGEGAAGISEEFLSRIPDFAFTLLKPQSPEVLKKIAEVKLQDLQRRLATADGAFGSIEIEWDSEVVDFVQEYHYSAEENARPIGNKVTSLIEHTIHQAFRQSKIEPKGQSTKIKLSVEQQSDKSWKMYFKVLDGRGDDVNQFELDIAATLHDRAKAPLSDERIDELLQIPNRLQKKVFGIHHIVERLTNAIIDAEEGRIGISSPDEATKPARSFMFLGLSSTGKTQTAKELAEILYKDRSKYVELDFSQVTSIQDIKTRILGQRDGLGNPAASDFMKHYDRNQGQLVVVLDEIANANPQHLKALYDILREPVVSTFSDNKERIMSGVTIIMTGNAGEEWYKNIPKEAPEYMRLEAMQQIHERIMSNPQTRRKMLESFFSEALINRVGEPNIFFFGPLGYKQVRQLTLLKLQNKIMELKPKESMRGWHVEFSSENSFLNIVRAFETEGFVLSEQGASIDRFIEQDFYMRLRRLLNEHKVPLGSKILLEIDSSYHEQEAQKGEAKNITLWIHPEGQKKPIKMFIPGKKRPTTSDALEDDRLLTALHEAGHELVRKVFFGDIYNHDAISIIPGVTEIAGQWVMYEGIARFQPDKNHAYTREGIVREIAVLAGGEMAQVLTTKGGRHDAGKSNDMERATKLAYNAVLRLGLSDVWGRETLSRETDLASYAEGLSPERRRLLEKEVNALLDEGRDLARKALLVNYDNALLPLGVLLAEKGILEKQDLDDFYSKNDVHRETSAKYNSYLSTWSPSKVKAKLSPYIYRKSTRDAQLLDNIPRPREMANIENIIREKKLKQLEEVELPDNLPLAASLDRYPSLKSGNEKDPEAQLGSETKLSGCAALLTL